MRLRPADQKLMALPKEAARLASLKASDTVCGEEGGVHVRGAAGGCDTCVTEVTLCLFPTVCMFLLHYVVYGSR